MSDKEFEELKERVLNANYPCTEDRLLYRDEKKKRENKMCYVEKVEHNEIEHGCLNGNSYEQRIEEIERYCLTHQRQLRYQNIWDRVHSDLPHYCKKYGYYINKEDGVVLKYHMSPREEQIMRARLLRGEKLSREELAKFHWGDYDIR